jgi:hypothetical protein
MPPPASYVDIDTIPFAAVVTQAAFNVANERWFRLVLASDAVAGFFTEIGGTFTPRYDLFEDDGSTLVRTINNANNNAWNFPLESGTYYLQVRKFGGGASNFDFTFHADTRPLDGFTVPEDAIVINDDTGLFPATVMQMDGTVVGYLRMPAGEIGGSLPTGESIWQDRFGRRAASGTLAVFDNTGAYVDSTSQTFSDFPIPVSITGSDTDFYAHEPTTGNVYRITTAGAVTLVATIPQATAIGVSADGTVLYYVDATDYLTLFDASDNVIHRWDLVNDEADPDFYTYAGLATDVGGLAVTANFWPAEILELPDGSVVTWARNEDDAEDVLLHISSGGTLLHSYTYAHASRQINHLGRPPGGGSDHINVWFYTPDDDTARFALVLLADGSEVAFFDTSMFTQGRNMEANTQQLFGPSTSCTMVTLLFTEVPSEASEGSGSVGDPEPVPTGAIGPISWIEWPEADD